MRIICLFTAAVFFLTSCGKKNTVLQHGNLVLSFDDQLHSMVATSMETKKPLASTFTPSEYLMCDNFAAQDFKLAEVSSNDHQDALGKGKKWMISGLYQNEQYSIDKIIEVKFYDQFPDQAFYKVFYINNSNRDLNVTSWINHHYKIQPQGDSIPFWSFQGESTGERRDWVLPVRAGFYQRNFMGMNDSDYGGGIPVTDIWRRDNGIAIGHAELVPKLVSLPVKVDSYDQTADINIRMDYDTPYVLKQGDTLATLETFVSVHQGDNFTTLKRFGEVLRAKGLKFAEPEAGAFESSWCAWGYMRNFTIDEVRGTLPKVKELGIKWVTIDDGYQQAEGDWHVNSKTFPKGDAQMRALVDDIHAQGLKVMIWWAPLAADPGSKVLSENPDLKLVTDEGAPQYITWWDSYYMSPAYTKTLDHTKEVLSLFYNTYNVDGIKMDGQHLNAVAPDYNDKHKLSRPEESVEAVPAFFKMIYEESNRLKPHALIQNCPCGTCMSVYNMPYMNQAVASDPLDSWQIRLKGKTYKAIFDKGAYFGDHVELSDEGSDFATSFGIGAVLGTKFTWPKDNPTVREKNVLTPEREVIWKKWFKLYDQKMLSKEQYLGELYDIGYDIPETHVIQKGDTLHYAFYNKSWDGKIELRGLTAGRYKIRDYVNDVELGEVTKESPQLNAKFKNSLLIEAYPVAE
jgi:alpha-galactosidase